MQRPTAGLDRLLPLAIRAKAHGRRISNLARCGAHRLRARGSAGSILHVLADFSGGVAFSAAYTTDALPEYQHVVLCKRSFQRLGPLLLRPFAAGASGNGWPERDGRDPGPRSSRSNQLRLLGS